MDYARLLAAFFFAIFQLMRAGPVFFLAALVHCAIVGRQAG
jgi:hypothetical protein